MYSLHRTPACQADPALFETFFSNRSRSACAGVIPPEYYPDVGTTYSIVTKIGRSCFEILSRISSIKLRWRLLLERCQLFYQFLPFRGAASIAAIKLRWLYSFSSCQLFNYKFLTLSGPAALSRRATWDGNFQIPVADNLSKSFNSQNKGFSNRDPRNLSNRRIVDAASSAARI
jgi:hypothetical protein